MAKIKQLSPHEAQKIAAGEVVERPANIVKELVENSIDAHATRISVYIEDGGKKLIRIVDNGSGMDFTDAQRCFDRHATSKITHVEDLESIQTFGFRGEALASIASVSTITLITKEQESIEGTKVTLNSGTITEINSVACATGTDISIHSLFDHIPARKKFLKATQTEWRAIQLLFNAFCFDYPHIHFLLFSENKQVLNCPVTTTMNNRALQLWENPTHNHLLELQTYTNATLSLSGIISDHQHHRYDRSNIYFFVNKRWVKNQHLSSAFIKGYANVLPAGKYPLAAIHITLPTNEVDINIHPRKEEVKFLHPRRVEQALQEAVKAALEKNLSLHLKMNVTLKSQNFSTKETSDNFNTPFPEKPFNFDATFTQQTYPLPFTPFDKLRANGENKQDSFPFVASLPKHTNKIDNNSLLTETNTQQPSSSLPFAPFDQLKANGANKQDFFPFVASLPNHTNTQNKRSHQLNVPHKDLSQDNSIIVSETQPYRLIGQYNATYLLIEQEDGLFLIDQHAAHERILYELFSKRFDKVSTIQLLFPHIITLSAEDIETITPYLDIFIKNGIIIEQCSIDQLIIQSLPVHLKDQSLDDLIKQALTWINEISSVESDIFQKTINNKLQAQMACKAAVKAGDILTVEQMDQLLKDLEKSENRFSCPHGRPTGWLLSLHEIEKKFKRRI